MLPQASLRAKRKIAGNVEVCRQLLYCHKTKFEGQYRCHWWCNLVLGKIAMRDSCLSMDNLDLEVAWQALTCRMQCIGVTGDSIEKKSRFEPEFRDQENMNDNDWECWNSYHCGCYLFREKIFFQYSYWGN